MFFEEINYLSRHEHINPDFFALLRYYISVENNFIYCKEFNKNLLLSKGYTEHNLLELEISTDNLLLDKKHTILFTTTILAINNPTEFSKKTLDELKTLGWTNSDIYDAIDHGAFLFKFSKILKAYLLDS